MAEIAHIHRVGGKPAQPMAWELLCRWRWHLQVGEGKLEAGGHMNDLPIHL